MNDSYEAHVIDDSGVTPSLFIRDGGNWSNAERIVLKPGAVLDLGDGITLTNGQSVTIRAVEVWPNPAQGR